MRKKRNYKAEYATRKAYKSHEALIDDYIREYNVKTEVVDNISYLVFYKAVTQSFQAIWAPYHFNNGKPYRPGNIVKVKRYSRDRNRDCASGLHVATLKWVRENFINTYNVYKYIKVLVKRKNIVCIPWNHVYKHILLEKIRVKELRVAHEVDSTPYAFAF